jgi:hypothetical protein
LTLNLAKISKKEVGVVVIPTSSYKKNELEITEYMSKRFKAVCCVNTNQSFDSLIEEMKRGGINEDKFLFIDTTKKNPDTEHKNCIYLCSPESLTTLSINIKKALQTRKFDAFLFNSPSSLLNYHKSQTLTRFIHDLFATVKKANLSAIFTMPAGSNKELMADISMFADYIIGVEKNNPLNKKQDKKRASGIGIVLLFFVFVLGLSAIFNVGFVGKAVSLMRSPVISGSAGTFVLLAFLTGLFIFLYLTRRKLHDK